MIEGRGTCNIRMSEGRRGVAGSEIEAVNGKWREGRGDYERKVQGGEWREGETGQVVMGRGKKSLERIKMGMEGGRVVRRGGDIEVEKRRDGPDGDGEGNSSLAATTLNLLGFEAPEDYDPSVLQKR